MDPIAHASVALIARPLAPKAPLWAMVAATQVPDALFFALQAAGLEHQAVSQLYLDRGLVYFSPPLIPWSHGLFMCLVWSGVVGVLGGLLTRDRRRGLVLGLLLFSHWFLDFTVYPNMPVLFGSTFVIGLGLITSQAGFIVGSLLEAALVVAGVVAGVRLWRVRGIQAAQA